MPKEAAAVPDEDRHFSSRPKQSFGTTLTGFLRAAYTVFMVPAHDSSMYEGVARTLRQDNQSLLDPIPREVAAIREICASLPQNRQSPRLTVTEQIGLMGVLMQFLSYLPKLRPYGTTPYAHTEALYQAIVKQGHHQPLGLAEQLRVALHQTDGDLTEALWRLFVTARVYARWFDTSIVSDLPEFTRDEVAARMEAWSRAIKAFKPYGDCPDQDASGDTYYCWTHALGKVAFQVLAVRQTPLTRLEALALRNGTRLNHGLAHRVKAQRLPSDHTIAAAYGNAIGDTLVEILLSGSSNTDR